MMKVIYLINRSANKLYNDVYNLRKRNLFLENFQVTVMLFYQL